MCVQKMIHGGGLSESYTQVNFLQSKTKLEVLVFFLQHVTLCFVNQNFSFQWFFQYIHKCMLASGRLRSPWVLQRLSIKSRFTVGFKENKSFVTSSDFWGVDRLSKLLKKQVHKQRQVLTSCHNCTNKRFYSIYNLLLLFQTLSVTSTCMGFGGFAAQKPFYFMFSACVQWFRISHIAYMG